MTSRCIPDTVKTDFREKVKREAEREEPQLARILSCFGDLLLTVCVTDGVKSDTFQKLSVGDIIEFLQWCLWDWFQLDYFYL